MSSIFGKTSTKVSSGRPERKEVTARIQEQMRRQAEEDLKNKDLPKDNRTLVYQPEY